MELRDEKKEGEKMNSILKVNGIEKYYGNKGNLTKAIDNISFEVCEGEFVGIMGPSGSGKTTLGKIISGQIKTKNIYFDETLIDPTKYIIYLDKNIKLNKNKLKKLQKTKVYSDFNLDITDISNVSLYEIQQLVNIAYAISLKPVVLILDRVLDKISNKKQILDYIKQKKITLINITNDIEQSLDSDKIIILNDGKIISNSKPSTILKNEKLLKENNIELPFMVDLSNKLKFYGLLENNILDINEMVETLWK